jgi:hypothetical protein
MLREKSSSTVDKLAPADDLEIGEVGLPELIGRSRLIFERIGCFDDNESRAGNQSCALSSRQTDASADEVALAIGEARGQLTRR